MFKKSAVFIPSSAVVAPLRWQSNMPGVAPVGWDQDQRKGPNLEFGHRIRHRTRDQNDG